MMKLTLLILLGLLLVTGLGCEPPYGGGYGYQYLGKVESIQFKHAEGYTTIVTVCTDIFVVEGRVDIPGLQNAYVWANMATKTLRLRGSNRMSAEHTILSAESRYRESGYDGCTNPHHVGKTCQRRKRCKSSEPCWYSDLM